MNGIVEIAVLGNVRIAHSCLSFDNCNFVDAITERERAFMAPGPAHRASSADAMYMSVARMDNPRRRVSFSAAHLKGPSCP